MKYLYLLVFVLLLFASCDEKDIYFYEDTPETVNSSMWEYLQTQTEFDYYTDLIKQYGIDSLFDSNNSYTLFLPTEEGLDSIDTTEYCLRNILLHHIVNTQINLQSIDEYEQIETLLGKYAVIEYDDAAGGYNVDGVSINGASSLFNNGYFYELEGCVMPALNLYEFFELYCFVLKDYVDYTDSSYFDIDASTPIAITDEGSIYDSVFYVINEFSEDFFPVEVETRSDYATFTIFTDDQYDSAIEIMKSDLGIDEVPSEWLNNIFMPKILLSCIFDKSLQYDDFQSKMLNIQGDSVDVDVSNIDEESRYICSNGVVYFFNDFTIADSLYKDYDPIYADDMVEVVVTDTKWTWSDIVSVEGLAGTDIAPEIQSSSYSENGSLLVLDLEDYDESDSLSITFTKEGVFGADNIRLMWAGTSAYCGLWNIYINGEPLQMRTYAGVDTENFDSYMFSESTIKSVTGLSNFKKQGNNYNIVDFEITTLTEYSNVEITFEYVGPSLDYKGDTQGVPGIVIDYLLLEIY
jgi:hypothetical protein